ncbi:MAG: biopolymer transporter ExbD [Gammaproteobacteria bacterium]|nr:biopolymer transporter ExbD [Gammaproteobacteria bacterium]
MSASLAAPPRRTRGSDAPLIPLINIVFLLLVFFMVAGQIAPTRDLGVEPPASQSRAPLPTAPLRLVLRRNGALSLDGHAVATANLAMTLGAAPRGAPVALAADHDVRAGTLAPVLTALRAAGLAEVTLYTRRADAP